MRLAKAMLPESLRRSCAIILGPEAAETLKFQLEAKTLRIPSDATISRFRLKLDVSCHYNIALLLLSGLSLAVIAGCQLLSD